MNPWHDISKERVKPDKFWAMIEISKGSKNKYELDKETGRLKLDRVLFTSTHYPQNYGFIPLTYSRDYDPLDVLVLCSEDILPMAFVECKPIGILTMIDSGLPDDKIIAVAVSDPFYKNYNDISELPEHIMAEIKHFFQVYKTLEGKDTSVDEFKSGDEAKRIIEEALNDYKRTILPNLHK
ncbi:MAG: inorganic diphosphatase [Erysipelotrichaceae bacterium]|nr:inorganic diphosphatase [Erysipelotrichaceae bacterium]